MLGDVDIGGIQEGMVKYAFVILKLYNLHNIPFTKITPKVQLDLDSDFYSIEIIDGTIIIKEGKVKKPDLLLKSTYEEIFKIMESGDYIKESVSLGKTSILPVANKFILFSKGYSSLYSWWGK